MAFPIGAFVAVNASITNQRIAQQRRRREEEERRRKEQAIKNKKDD